jgi:type VI secretion system secreted protein Hcp
MAGCLALTAAVAPRSDDSRPSSAAVVAYLRIDDIQGSATARGYEGWMEVTAFEWNLTSTAGTATGASHTASRAVFAPVVVAKPYDMATPFLALACASGRTYREAELVIFAGGSTTPAGRVMLTDVTVISTMTGGGLSGPTTESISLDFGKIEWIYAGPRGEQRTGWDVAANRSM